MASTDIQRWQRIIIEYTLAYVGDIDMSVDANARRGIYVLQVARKLLEAVPVPIIPAAVPIIPAAAGRGDNWNESIPIKDGDNWNESIPIKDGDNWNESIPTAAPIVPVVPLFAAAAGRSEKRNESIPIAEPDVFAVPNIPAAAGRGDIRNKSTPIAVLNIPVAAGRGDIQNKSTPIADGDIRNSTWYYDKLIDNSNTWHPLLKIILMTDPDNIFIHPVTSNHVNALETCAVCKKLTGLYNQRATIMAHLKQPNGHVDHLRFDATCASRVKAIVEFTTSVKQGADVDKGAKVLMRRLVTN